MESNSMGTSGEVIQTSTIQTGTSERGVGCSSLFYNWNPLSVMNHK